MTDYVPLTIQQYLQGCRTPNALCIFLNPFFQACCDREHAEQYVIATGGLPVLRTSSRPGLFAISYLAPFDRRVQHTLIAQNEDLSIDILTNSGVVDAHLGTLYELLDRVLTHTSLPAHLYLSAPRVERPVACEEDPR